MSTTAYEVMLLTNAELEDEARAAVVARLSQAVVKARRHSRRDDRLGSTRSWHTRLPSRRKRFTRSRTLIATATRSTRLCTCCASPTACCASWQLPRSLHLPRALSSQASPTRKPQHHLLVADAAGVAAAGGGVAGGAGAGGADAIESDKPRHSR